MRWLAALLVALLISSTAVAQSGGVGGSGQPVSGGVSGAGGIGSFTSTTALDTNTVAGQMLATAAYNSIDPHNYGAFGDAGHHQLRDQTGVYIAKCGTAAATFIPTVGYTLMQWQAIYPHARLVDTAGFPLDEIDGLGIEKAIYCSGQKPNLYGPASGARAVIVTTGTYHVTEAIDDTNVITYNARLIGQGATLDCETMGHVCLVDQGTRNHYTGGFHLNGNCGTIDLDPEAVPGVPSSVPASPISTIAAAPSILFANGRTAKNGDNLASQNIVSDMTGDGCFTKIGRFANSPEGTTWIRPQFYSSTDGAYAAVDDGCSHFAYGAQNIGGTNTPVSTGQIIDYVTFPSVAGGGFAANVQDVRGSYVGLHEIQPDYRSSSGFPVRWVCGLRNWNVGGSAYMVNSAPYTSKPNGSIGVEDYEIIGSTMLYPNIDVHKESSGGGTGSSDGSLACGWEITGPGAGNFGYRPYLQYYDFTYHDESSGASVEFCLDPSAGILGVSMLNHSDTDISNFAQGINTPVFAPGLLAVLNYTGKLTVANVSNYIAGVPLGQYDLYAGNQVWKYAPENPINFNPDLLISTAHESNLTNATLATGSQAINGWVTKQNMPGQIQFQATKCPTIRMPQNCVEILNNTSVSTPTASQHFDLCTTVLGQDMQALNWPSANNKISTPMWINQYIYTNLAGVYPFSFTAANYQYTYTGTVTIADGSNANIPSQLNTGVPFTIYVPTPAAGSWPPTGVGGYLCVGLADGANYQNSSSVQWNVTPGSGVQSIGIAGGVNFLGTMGATAYLSGAQIYANEIDVPEQTRPYLQEAALDSFLYQKSIATGTETGSFLGPISRVRFPILSTTTPTRYTYFFAPGGFFTPNNITPTNNYSVDFWSGISATRGIYPSPASQTGVCVDYNAVAKTISATQAGTALTVASGGSVAIGSIISGAGVIANEYVVSGSSPNYVVSQSATISTAESMSVLGVETGVVSVENQTSVSFDIVVPATGLSVNDRGECLIDVVSGL